MKAVVDAIGASRAGLRLSPWSEFQGMLMKEPVPQFSDLISQVKSLKLAYLHLIESRVNNWADCEKTQGIEFALNLWANQSPVLVAGGFTATLAKTAVDEEYKDFDVAVVFGRYFVSTPDLVFRIKNGIDPNPYDRSTFYVPESEKGYIDYPLSSEFKAAQKV
jgi:NADPH2 dehydrogenase